MDSVTLTTILTAIACLALGAIIGYEIGRRLGRAAALSDAEIRKLEADWMREQRGLMEALK